jgi:mannose-6-phosphate isomerase-like protein (cupin superfamily)
MERKFLGRSPSPSGSLLIPVGAGEQFDTGRLGTHWKINGSQTGGGFSVVHHQLPPRTLAAPLHRHRREDEHSYVLIGSFGALLGEAVVKAELGTRVCKPRGQWHTFWNTGTRRAKSSKYFHPAVSKSTFVNCVQSGPTETRRFRFFKSGYGFRQRPKFVCALWVD